MTQTYYVYILATRKDGPIYIGVTNDLHRRVFEHKTHAIRGVHGEVQRRSAGLLRGLRKSGRGDRAGEEVEAMAARVEVALIARDNPEWRDLADQFAP